MAKGWFLVGEISLLAWLLVVSCSAPIPTPEQPPTPPLPAPAPTPLPTPAPAPTQPPEATPPAKTEGIEVVSLDINPNPIKVEEETTITITIQNAGEVEDTHTTSLEVDGLVEQTWDVTLAGGATKSLSVSVSKDSPGSYSVAVGGKEAILKVWQPLPTEAYFVSEVIDQPHGFAVVDN